MIHDACLQRRNDNREELNAEEATKLTIDLQENKNDTAVTYNAPDGELFICF